ncbi:MAG: NYN domain-containing protein [Rhodoferax sp.]
MANEKVSDAAFLIDADNLPPLAVDEAFRHMKKLGLSVSVRRAYGGHEKLAGMKEVLKRHAIRAFVNQGKGTTDVLLAVDAMDLLHGAVIPATVAIGSSDADFAPLAVRLRENGMRVICFAQRDKSADELPLAYDEVVEVEAPQTAKTPTPGAVLETPAPARERVLASVPKPVIAVTPRLLKNAEPAAVAPSSDEVQAIQRILAALPDWLPNTIRQLNQLGVPLRESGVKTGSKPLHHLFAKYPDYFKVLPTNGPAKQVRLLKNA